MKFSMSLFFIMLLVVMTGAARAEPISCVEAVISGVPVTLIRVDLRAPGIYVTPALAPGYQEVAENYTTISLQEMLTLYEPAAAINGPFFDVRSGRVVCALARDGALISEGELGSSLVMDKEGSLHMHLTAGMRARKMVWSRASWGLSCGPTLVYEGKKFFSPRLEGFTSSSLYRPARRSALGVTRRGELLMVTTGSTSLEKLAGIMLELGAWHAINLDGGSSCAMAYGGSILTPPSRKLPGYILVYRKKEDATFLSWPDIGKYIERRASIRARTFYLNAYPAFMQGRFFDSLGLALKACELDEDNATYFDMAARCNEGLRRNGDAARMYTRCAYIQALQGRSDLAVKTVEHALRIDPSDRGALEARSLLQNSPETLGFLMHVFSGDLRHALNEPDPCGRANPTVATFLAEAYRKTGDSKRAARCYGEAGELFLGQQGSFEGYLAAKGAVELDPEVPAYHALLARAARARGDENTAAFQEVIVKALGRESDHFKVF